MAVAAPTARRADREGGMKGVIFNLAEEVIVQSHGEDGWDALLDAAGLEGSYSSLGNYPDGELARLVKAASQLLQLTPQEVVRRLGEGALPLLAARYPGFFAGHASTRPFLLTLNDIIHAEVRKLYPGAEVPEFDFDDSDPAHLILGYRSARRLCALAEGFIVGAARYYGEEVSLDQQRCMHRGDDRCVIRCAFTPAGP
jgi:Haem-NO-binding